MRQPPAPIHRLFVTARAGPGASGRLRAGHVTVPCMLGPAGIIRLKREGDGATPAGAFRLLCVYRRHGQLAFRCSLRPSLAIRKDDVWCDAPGHRLYNRPSRLPLPASHENLWRSDHVYDVVVVLGYNLRPRVQGRGSAVFFHLTRDPPTPTAGCVAIDAAAMRRLLPRLGKHCVMAIGR